MNDYLASFVGILINILYFAMIGRVIMSWINVGPSSPFYPIANMLYQITEPVLAPIRRVLPTFGMLDLSPMVAMLVLYAIRKLFVTALAS